MDDRLIALAERLVASIEKIAQTKEDQARAQAMMMGILATRVVEAFDVLRAMVERQAGMGAPASPPASPPNRRARAR